MKSKTNFHFIKKTLIGHRHVSTEKKITSELLVYVLWVSSAVQSIWE